MQQRQAKEHADMLARQAQEHAEMLARHGQEQQVRLDKREPCRVVGNTNMLPINGKYRIIPR